MTKVQARNNLLAALDSKVGLGAFDPDAGLCHDAASLIREQQATIEHLEAQITHLKKQKETLL